MRILVTGGAGFIGSHVADGFLACGAEVAVFDNLSTGRRQFVNPRARFYEADLTDSDAVERCLAEFRPDVVNHHAAQIDVRRSVDDPIHDARTNVLGTLSLLQGCTRHGVKKLIYASTGGALYGEAQFLPATEEHPVNPESPYGVSKHTVEHYLYLWRLLHGLDYTTLRYPNVYGSRQNPHGEAGVSAIFIGLMLQGKPPRVFGDGMQVRDYLFVEDVVEANRLAVSEGGGETLNLGTGVGTSVNDIVREINAILGTRLEPIYLPPRPGEVQRIYLDAARAKRVLGWVPRVVFSEGLKKTVEWSRAQSARSPGGGPPGPPDIRG